MSEKAPPPEKGSSRDLAERGLQTYTRLKDLVLHERAAVLQIAGTLLQADARTAELAQAAMQQNFARTLTPSDEHFRA